MIHLIMLAFFGAEILVTRLAGIGHRLERGFPILARCRESRAERVGCFFGVVSVAGKAIPLLPYGTEGLARMTAAPSREELGDLFGGRAEFFCGCPCLGGVEWALPLTMSPISFICFC